jgi:CspA family cold shock protein
VQGVVRSYDPGTRQGSLMCDTDMADYELADDALADSVFRMLRQGQRVVFDLDGAGRATRLRLGSEVDMGTPGFDAEGVAIPKPPTVRPAAPPSP